MPPLAGGFGKPWLTNGDKDAFGMQIRIKPSWRGLAWGGLALVLAITGCTGLYRSADPPRVTLAGIRVLDLSLFEQRYLLALRIQNPNRFELPIEGMKYMLELNGSEFAHGVNNQQITIPALGEEVLQVSVVTDLLSTLEQLRRWEGKTPSQKLDYRLRGKIEVANLAFALPFEYSGAISLQGLPGNRSSPTPD
ncbi:MAG: LEA type 2 family protein [Nitrococcus mobilis]|nr:LEA type 2 family protein [Nitrococcus mobilis]